MIPGQVLAERYELRELLGRGGMGQVWAGYDLVLHRDVALKVLDTHATRDPDAAERFRREATATAALTHSHVVTIHDAGIEDDLAYLVMELLPGPTVADLIRDRGPLPVDLAVRLGRQAAEGLDAAHRAGVVHRDVKPSNLMLDGHDRLKVVDFGIARLAETTASQVTVTGTVIGSAAYLSPEQAHGRSATPASDHYALGCVMMAMLTGEPPFSAEHPMGLLRQHLNDPPPRVSDRRRDVPPWVDQVVDDLLSKDPAVRSAAFAGLLRTPDPTPAAAEPGQTAILPITDEAPAVRVARRGPRPLTWLSLIGMVLLALLAIPVLAQVFADGDDPPGSSSTEPSPTGSTPLETPDVNRPTAGPADLPSAVDHLDDVLARAIRTGGIDEKVADDLAHKVSDLRKRIDEGKTDDIDKKLDELEKKIGERQEKGEVDATSAARLHQAIDGVRTAA